MTWLKDINWNLFDQINLTDLAFLREPVLWMAFLASVFKAVADAVGAGADVWTIVVIVVNMLLGLFARAQVSAPYAPKGLRKNR